MMEFRLGSANNVRLCFVSTFRLNVPFERERDSDSGLLRVYGDSYPTDNRIEISPDSDSGLLRVYGDWKEDVESKFQETSGRYSLSWSAPNEVSSGQQNFADGCFLESSVNDLDGFTSILEKLDVFAGLYPWVTFLKIRLWEFGFGSVKVGVSFASLESDKIIEIEEKKIIDELKKENFYLKLESLIESDIICRCRSGDESDSSSQSFAEKVMQYKEKKIEQQVGKLSESLVLVEFNVEDSEFSNQSNLLSKSLYDVSTEKKSPVENFNMFCSEDRDVIVFLRVGDDDSSKNIAERILVQVSFLQYTRFVGKIYLLFFLSNFKKLYKEKQFKGPIEINKINPRGRESIIAQERRKVNLIYEEIEIISQVIYESNYQMNSLFASDANIINCRIHNGLSSILNFTALQSIVKDKYSNIEYQYNKIDKTASYEASIGQARSYKILGVVSSLFIFFLSGYQNNLDWSLSISLVVIMLILLYVLRNWFHYMWARVFEQLEIYRHKKLEIYRHKKKKDSASSSDDKSRLSNDKLWILMDQKNKCIKTMFWLYLVPFILLYVAIFLIKLIEYLFWLLFIFVVVYLLILGNPQTSVPKDPETPSSTPTTIDTSLPPKISVPELPISTTTTLQTTTTIPPEMQSTPPPPRQSMCPKRFFHFKQCQSAGFFGDRE